MGERGGGKVEVRGLRERCVSRRRGRRKRRAARARPRPAHSLAPTRRRRQGDRAHKRIRGVRQRHALPRERVRVDRPPCALADAWGAFSRRRSALPPLPLPSPHSPLKSSFALVLASAAAVAPSPPPPPVVEAGGSALAAGSAGGLASVAITGLCVSLWSLSLRLSLLHEPGGVCGVCVRGEGALVVRGVRGGQGTGQGESGAREWAQKKRK